MAKVCQGYGGPLINSVIHFTCNFLYIKKGKDDAFCLWTSGEEMLHTTTAPGSKTVTSNRFECVTGGDVVQN